MKNAICRRILRKDIDSLSRLLLELGYCECQDALAERVQAIERQGNIVLVAEVTDRIVGAVQAMVDIRLAEGRFGEIVSLIVTESHRRYGIGKMLLQHAIAWLASNHCPVVRVRANTTRDDAHNFYKTVGFEYRKSQSVFVCRIG